MTKLAIALAALILIIFSSCSKQQITTDKTAELAFSTDSIKFDTVFTSVGSATMNFLVKNPNKKAVSISNIRLGGGTASYFKINVNGHPGTQFTNTVLAGGDSMFVFVQVTINPTLTSTPFIVTDSILFQTNGNLQMVKLVAFGQNAHFFASQEICNMIWSDTLKPYVIYNSILVGPGCTLTIEPSVKVYSHKGSAIIVQGTLNVIGQPNHPVTFTSDRLEQFYATAPGQWYGIWFATYNTANNGNGTGRGSFTNAVIKNAVIGVESDSMVNKVDSVYIYQTKIQNMATAGIYGKSANITGKDLLVNNCGQFLFIGQYGGTYNFAYCTFDNSDAAITSSSAGITLANNSYVNSHMQTVQFPLTANFTDCIIWGTTADEVELDSFKGTTFSSDFKYNIIRASLVPFNSTNKINTDPLFKDPYDGIYHFLSTSSPAINFNSHTIGDSLGVSYDINNISRQRNIDVVGCYVN